MTKAEVRRFTSWLGKRSYRVRLERFGIERLQEIARDNGQKGGRPRLPDSQVSPATLYRRKLRKNTTTSTKGG